MGAEEKLKILLFERAKEGRARNAILLIAALFTIIEVFYVLHFNITLFKILSELGVKLDILLSPSFLNQIYPAKAVILSLMAGTAFILYPIRKTADPRIPLYDWVLALIGFAAPLYIVYLYMKHHTVEAAISEATLGSIIAIIAIIAVIAEASRRAIGWILALIMLAFSAYGFIYAYTHRPLGVEGIQWVRRLINLFIAQNTGFLGIPLEVMATYVFAFLFFSSILEKLGIGKYITELILALVGRRPGGPAKVAVVSSALMGTISGSSVANTLTTGTFTIPTMKRAGFPPEVAGAIEPVASTGGQLMPPIMGAAAFIMAEFIGRPYRDIVIAAALPAIIYFYSIYVFVDREAKKRKIGGLREEEIPSLREMLRKLYYLLPIPVIIIALLKIEPQDAVMAALSTAIVIGWIASKDLLVPGKIGLIGALIAIALFVWKIIGLGFATGIFVAGVLSVLVALVMGLLLRGAKGVALAIVEAVESTLRNSVPVFLAAASASVIQAMISFTNLHATLGRILLEASMGYLYLLLVMTAIFSIILGMGVPTTANYIITATILAPTLVSFSIQSLQYPEEVAKISSHMFVLYYGILADITPPVALAAFVGAALARANFWKTAINSTIYGFAKYIIPYVIVVSPVILIVTVDQWTSAEILRLAYTIGGLLTIIYAASAGFVGYLNGQLENKYLRYTLIILAILSVSMKPYFLAATLILYIAVYVMNARKNRNQENTIAGDVKH
ncbi:MAG: TRAP transporter permease [Desulfurococcales archaeon]|nr:TRAP transporter permease [Desulfurococcales archaeon]